MVKNFVFEKKQKTNKKLNKGWWECKILIECEKCICIKKFCFKEKVKCEKIKNI